MAKRRQETGEERQDRIQREQHRPEQNRGYDEAVKSGAGVADERPDRMVPMRGDDTQLQNTTENVDEREAERAREEVRRRDRSASLSESREP
jgi:hypothetical protein